MFSKPFKSPSGIKIRTALQASKLPGPSRNRPQGSMQGQYFLKQCEYNVKQLILRELNFQKQIFLHWKISVCIIYILEMIA